MEKFWKSIAWFLPKELVKWCFVRLYVSGLKDNEIMGEIDIFTALKRWSQPCPSKTN